MKDKVTIIVPAYNCKKTLRRCVRSLQRQTYPNIAILLVDDGSTDGSGILMDRLAAADERIQVIHRANGGPAEARDTGIRAVEGDGYTTFCDSDDWMPRNGIELLVDLAKEYDADLATGLLTRVLWRIPLKPGILPAYVRRRCYNREEIRRELSQSYYGITNFHGYLPTKLYRNELLKKSLGFEKPVRSFQEDIAFNMQIIEHAERIAVMPKIVYKYAFGGGTSRFMKTYIADCVSLYAFKKKMIQVYSYPKSYMLTTQIELKNELYCWLAMFFKHVANDGVARREIARCCALPEIREAVSYEKADHSGVEGFKELVAAQDVDGIYNLVSQRVRKERFKDAIRKIMYRII